MAEATSPSWPRGFPLERVKDNATHRAPWQRGVSRRVGVLQSLADIDPDVDAIYRLVGTPLPFVFPGARKPPTWPAQPSTAPTLEQLPTACPMEPNELPPSAGASSSQSWGLGGPPVSVPLGTMMPTNAQASLHAYDALWALLLPSTVHGRVSDIWRGYMAQRLMWNLDLVTAFARPWVVQYRNSHNYLADLAAEQPLYRQAGEVIRVLREWQPAARTLPGQIEELYVLLYELDILEARDVALAQAWLSDLLHVGYEFPHPQHRRSMDFSVHESRDSNLSS
jgi:hypothetical protein